MFVFFLWKTVCTKNIKHKTLLKLRRNLELDSTTVHHELFSRQGASKTTKPKLLEHCTRKNSAREMPCSGKKAIHLKHTSRAQEHKPGKNRVDDHMISRMSDTIHDLQN